MKKIRLEKRSLNRKLNLYRKHGYVPGIVYGPSIDSTPIKLHHTILQRAEKARGEVFMTKLDNKNYLVKIGEIQRDPVTRQMKHVSLVQMPKGIENSVEIPVELKGQPVGVQRGGVLVHLKDKVEVFGKPTKLPETIKTDISELDIGEKLVVDDLNLPKTVSLEDDANEVIAVCRPPAKPVEVMQAPPVAI